MKKLATLAFGLTSLLASAQAFNGKGDQKLNIGANIQDGGTGIVAVYDYGLGENISVGVYGTYILGTSNYYDNANFGDKIDIRARFNANIGNVIGLPSQIDVYPGLNLGLKNFGGHVGARYFFTDGFGVNTEFAFPISRYNNHVYGHEHLNNQFQWNIGVSFNL